MNQLGMFAALVLVIGVGGAAMAAPYRGDTGWVVPDPIVSASPQIAGPAQRCSSCTIPERPSPHRAIRAQQRRFSAGLAVGFCDIGQSSVARCKAAYFVIRTGAGTLPN